MQLKDSHLKAICKSKTLSKPVGEQLEDPAILTRALESLSDDDREYLRDIALDVWVDHSPCVDEREGYNWEGDTFPIGVCGVKGAYYVFAQEFDNEGPFSTRAQAVAAMESNYGDYFEDPTE